MYDNGKRFITLEGGIGVGKTTLAKRLAKDLGYEVYEEALDGDVKEFRTKFYSNMKEYAFPFQIKLFQRRFRQHLEILMRCREHGAVQDRSLYGDKPFAYMLHKAGMIDDDRIRIYEETWEMMRHFTVNPDIMIFLYVTNINTELQRIKDRGREEEKDITTQYLAELTEETWLMREDKMRDGVYCPEYNWDDPNRMYPTLLAHMKQELNKPRSAYRRFA